MSDNDDDLLLLGGAETTNNKSQQSSEKKDKKEKKSKKEKKEKKSKKDKKDKKKSGKRRQRDESDDDDDEEPTSEEEVDEGDIIDFTKEIESSADSDEDEEGGEDEDGKKKKKKRKGAQFVADAASEGDDDGEANDEEAEMEDDDLSYLDTKRPVTKLEADLLDDNVDDAELAKRLEARYATQKQKPGATAAAASCKHGAAVGKKGRQGRQQQDYDQDDDEGFVARHIEDDTAQFAAAFLPRPEDAKVYAVKVRGVFSKLLVTRLVSKCYAYLQGQNVSGIRQDLGILSVFSLPHVNEFIYVESHRQKFVETALAGLDGCFRFRITELTTDAVMQLFTAPIVNQLGGLVRKGELLRVRNGPYKLDLGEVVDVLEEGKRALLRLVPRLDFVNKEFIHVKGAAFGKKKEAVDENANINTSTASRPAQRLFAPALAIGSIARPPNRYIWGTHEFDENGYLLKDFTVRQLFCGTAKGIVPEARPEELQLLFQLDPTALSNHLMNSKPTDAPLAFNSNTRVVYYSERFRIQDPVRVISGQLAGVTGRIEEMQPSEGRAVIRVNVQEHQHQQQQLHFGPRAPLTTTLTIDLSEACKLFSVGDQIAIERGPHKGDTGVVLNAEGISITYYSDSGKGHCSAEANDCSSAAQSSSKAKSVGPWRLFDIVVLVDDRTVGCIVSLSQDSCELLTQNNSTTRVPFSSIKHRYDGRGKRKPTDAYGNQIMANRETAVEVLSVAGAPLLFAGRVCGVKEVYEDVVFVRCNEVREHSGIGAVNAKVCRVLSGAKKQETIQQKFAQQPSSGGYNNNNNNTANLGGLLQLPGSLQKPAISPIPNLFSTFNAFLDSKSAIANNNNNNTASVNYDVPSAAYTTAYGE